MCVRVCLREREREIYVLFGCQKPLTNFFLQNTAKLLMDGEFKLYFNVMTTQRRSVVWFCFFITKSCSKTLPSLHHFACSCFLVGQWYILLSTLKKQLHAMWHHWGTVLLQCLEINKQNHTTRSEYRTQVGFVMN